MDSKVKRLLMAAVIVISVAGVEYVTGIEILGIATRSATDPVATVQTETTGEAPSGPYLRLATWNLYNFGRSKNDREMAFIAETLRDYDIVAIQEVSTGPAGAQAVGRLVDELDRRGFDWDYRLSDPTSGDGSERYAYVWKTSRAQIKGRAWLEPTLSRSIDREPYMARFQERKSGSTFLVASIHAVPRSKDPEHEVRQLDALHPRYASDHLVVLGDFNLDEDHEAFSGFRRLGYRAVLDDQPTSLRRKRRTGPNGHLANEYDNIFVEMGPLHISRGGIADFTTAFSTLREARRISDHLPVHVDIQWTATSAPAP
ncbi:endonuclease [Longibacter salinarum]|uniref:Endonuclease n=1 Tax=Longibacter salinarum TaxID=1850348 RepID=A0A2A8CWT4_9BACT|nr:endonuclease/exonuclease/phosphatase family protein [Longibacter salinarum]PEN13057.1 endonuclease [Longibacter salinarum]